MLLYNKSSTRGVLGEVSLRKQDAAPFAQSWGLQSLWPKCFLCIANGITEHGGGPDLGFYYWDEWCSLMLLELMTKVMPEHSPCRQHAFQTSSVGQRHKSSLWVRLLDTVGLGYADIWEKLQCHAALDILTFGKETMYYQLEISL